VFAREVLGRETLLPLPRDFVLTSGLEGLDGINMVDGLQSEDSGSLPVVDSGTSAEEVFVVMVNQKFIRPALKGNAKSVTEAIEALSELEVLALKAKIDADGEAEVAGSKILKEWLTFKAKGARQDSKDTTLKVAKPQSDIGTTIKDGDAQTTESVVVGAPSIVFPSGGALEGAKSKKKPALELKNVSFRYGIDKPFVVSGVSGKLCLDSRVAICGSGKSTLMKMICSELRPVADKVGRTGEVRHLISDLRLAVMPQDHMKILDACSDLTPFGYISKRFQDGYDEELQQRLMQTEGMEEAESKSISTEAAGSDKRPLTSREIRKHFKNFGIDEEMCSNTQISSLSTSQKVCLSLAALFWTKPHIIAVDEFPKGLDTETMEALSLAFQNFQGAILLVETEGCFADKVCSEKWTLEDGLVTVAKTTTGLK